MLTGGSKAKATTKLLDSSKKESKKVSNEKLLPGSKEDKSLPGSKISKPSSSLIKRPKLSIVKIKPNIKPSTEKEGGFDMNKLDELLQSLVDNTETLKKVTKKDVEDEKKKNKEKEKTSQKVKAVSKEEKIERTNEKTEVKGKIKLPETPDFLKGIFGFMGRLTLSVGIMTLLNWLTDPENKKSLFSFLEENITTITLGMLGIIGATFVASFLPVIGIVGSLLSILTPVLTAMIGLLLNPIVLSAIGIVLGAIGIREFLYRHFKPLAEKFYKNTIQPGVNEFQYGKERAAEGQFVRSLYDNYGRISSQQERDKLTPEEKTTASFLRIYENKLKELATAERVLPGAKGTRKDSVRKDIERLKKELLQLRSQLTIGGKSMDELQSEYERDGTLPQTSIQKGVTPQPVTKPQTPTIPQETSKPTQETSTQESGKVVEYLTGDRSHSGYRADHGGGNYHEHLAFSSTAERDSAVELLKSKGIVIGSMNDGRHVPGSYHYSDQAFDVPLYPNIQNLGIPDNREGEEKFSSMVRKILYEGGFKGKGMGEGLKPRYESQIKKSSPSDVGQKVSYQAPYEQQGTQVAFVQVPVPMPVETPVSVGGGRGSSGSSFGSVNTYSDLFLASRYSEA